MTTEKNHQKRSAVVFPKNQKILSQLGENIKLACKRRKYTQVMISERTGLSRLTIRKIEQGDPKVSMGHYVAVLSVLGLVEDLTRVASDDELGRKLQDIELLNK
ncbi:helix-turn-helix domain-containing protein [Brenneria tiliae]|uniref:helix-turn-helix domain-containing protein n=1 Tax=Brenneria tiliae TaxID=2914984 RepID=UPI00201489D7|nr:helix-turn-helix domain-containing protein [Brenneria tiliae]MCL2899290.1 helix-turn-helix domain-containing protein [Brenneria tiliae]MCL2903668.1 helix-turn-helix domain-containing protein [Brenneria tiliae]